MLPKLKVTAGSTLFLPIPVPPMAEAAVVAQPLLAQGSSSL